MPETTQSAISLLAAERALMRVRRSMETAAVNDHAVDLERARRAADDLSLELQCQRMLAEDRADA